MNYKLAIGKMYSKTLYRGYSIFKWLTDIIFQKDRRRENESYIKKTRTRVPIPLDLQEQFLDQIVRPKIEFIIEVL
jgi:hypothetical protein